LKPLEDDGDVKLDVVQLVRARYVSRPIS